MPDLEKNIDNLVQDLTKPGEPRYGKFIRGGERIWYDRGSSILHKQMLNDAGMSEADDSGRIRIIRNTQVDIYGISADLPVPTVDQRNKTLEIVSRLLHPLNLKLFEERVKDTLDILLRQ